MSQLAITATYTTSVDSVLEKLEPALKEVGFGILTRIDFDQKMKEKLGADLPRTVILGACNPRLAYEAYQQNPEVTLLVPCNVVVSSVGDNKTRVEMIRPSQMMGFLPGLKMSEMIAKAEKDLENLVSRLMG